MNQPVLFNISAFDAREPHAISFMYSGNQSVKNELIVRNNVTNEIVYQGTQSTFLLQHTIPVVLINGQLYNAQIRVYDVGDNVSPWSNPIVFHCFSTPIFEFSNVNNNQIIETSQYEFNINYVQDEGEPLNNYRILLYENGATRFDSGLLYNSDQLGVTIGDLEDNLTYQIKAIGETLNGMSLETPLISFSVDYLQPALFAIVDLENQCERGQIRVRSNVKILTGTSNPDPAIYDGSKVILLEDGSWVRFEEGFSIANDFTLQVEGEHFKEYSTILFLESDKCQIDIQWMLGTFDGRDVAYCSLTAYSKDHRNVATTYYIYSNFIDIPLETDVINIWVRRQGLRFEIIIANKSI